MQNPYEDFRGNISKSSGKIPAFIIYLEEVGKAKFRREYGRNPFMRDEGDKLVLHDYYQSLSPEERQMYKNRERNSVQNTQNVYLKKRESDNERTRRNKHADIEGSLQATEKHKAKIHQIQDEKVKIQGPILLEKRRTIFDPNLLLESDFKAKRQRDRDQLSGSLKFNLIGGSTDIVLDQLFCFIGATPSFSVISRLNKEATLVTVPLELSIVRFTLRQGIISRHSYHMNIDPAVALLNEDPDVISKQKEKSKCIARYFGFEEHYTFEELMAEAWWFAKENCPPEAKIVVETDNFNFVAMALRFLANRVSPAEGCYAQTHFDDHIYCIEDIAQAFAAVSGKEIDDSVVHRYFQRRMIADNAYCPIHGEMHVDDERRPVCQEARGAVNIQRLIDFLRLEGLLDMDKIYDATNHTFCHDFPEGKKIRKLPKQELLSHEELGTRIDNLMFSEPEDDQNEYIDPIVRRKVVKSLRGEGTSGTRQLNGSPAPGPSNMIPSFDIPGPSTAPPNNWDEPAYPPAAAAPFAPPADIEYEEPPPPQLGSTTRHPSGTVKINQTDTFQYNWSIAHNEDRFLNLKPFLEHSLAAF